MSEVAAADELLHAAGAELSWHELYGFDLYDPAAELGGLIRMEVRPNEGTAEVALSFILGDGGFITARHVEPKPADGASLEVEGARFAMLEPLRRWRLSYDGPGHSIGSVRDAGKREAWAKSRLERLIVDLEFEALHRAVPAAAGFAQAGRWTGEVWVSGDRYAIQAHGIREKRWGAAPLPLAERRFALTFGDGCAIGVVQTKSADDDALHGWILRDGRVAGVRSVELATETEPGSCLQKAFRLVLNDDAGQRHGIAGEMLQLAPLPGFRGGRETLLCEGVARAEYDGKRGYGVVGYLHQLDADGSPVEPVR